MRGVLHLALNHSLQVSPAPRVHLKYKKKRSLRCSWIDNKATGEEFLFEDWPGCWVWRWSTSPGKACPSHTGCCRLSHQWLLFWICHTEKYDGNRGKLHKGNWEKDHSLIWTQEQVCEVTDIDYVSTNPTWPSSGCYFDTKTAQGAPE